MSFFKRRRVLDDDDDAADAFCKDDVRDDLRNAAYDFTDDVVASPGAAPGESANDASVDPLDLFMQDVHATLAQDTQDAQRKETDAGGRRVQQVIDEPDPLDLFMHDLHADLNSRNATVPVGATMGVGEELSRKAMRNGGATFKTQASSDQHCGNNDDNRDVSYGDYGSDDPDLTDDDEERWDFYANDGATQKAPGVYTGKDVNSAGYNSDEEVYMAAQLSEFGGQKPVGFEPGKKNAISMLAPLDHTKIKYLPFRKCFYTPVKDIVRMTTEDIERKQRELHLSVTGSSALIAPCWAFEQFGFDGKLVKVIEKQHFAAPSAIQAQAIPTILSGNDLIGIAQTGSGKTLAFLWPLIVHVLDQPALGKGEGPIALIIAPTRELASQILAETKKYVKPYNLVVVDACGGLSKTDQFRTMKAGCEVVVCTPGRMMDMIAKKACTMTRTTLLILDEADRMFSLGFESQIRSIVNQIRDDRQTLLFSATFSRRIERLARDILSRPVRIQVGELNASNKDVRQVVHVMEDEPAKQEWVLQHLYGFLIYGNVLIFMSTRSQCEQMNAQLNESGFDCRCIHGDLDQADRTATIKAFKRNEFKVLIATDIAARGLDIKNLQTVISYDMAKNIDSHVHRIGRTGRTGQVSEGGEQLRGGTAYTLLTSSDYKVAGLLVENLEQALQDVPEALTELAYSHGPWAKKRIASRGQMRAMAGRGGGVPIEDSNHAVPPPTQLQLLPPPRIQMQVQVQQRLIGSSPTSASVGSLLSAVPLAAGPALTHGINSERMRMIAGQQTAPQPYTQQGHNPQQQQQPLWSGQHQPSFQHYSGTPTPAACVPFSASSSGFRQQFASSFVKSSSQSLGASFVKAQAQPLSAAYSVSSSSSTASLSPSFPKTDAIGAGGTSLGTKRKSRWE